VDEVTHGVPAKKKSGVVLKAALFAAFVIVAVYKERRRRRKRFRASPVTMRMATIDIDYGE
jgi:hypothetical protein